MAGVTRESLIRHALMQCLMPEPGGAGGLPVPPLLAIIARYAVPFPLLVSTLTTAHSRYAPTVVRVPNDDSKRLLGPISVAVWKPNRAAPAASPVAGGDARDTKAAKRNAKNAATLAAEMPPSLILIATNTYHCIFSFNIKTAEVRIWSGQLRAMGGADGRSLGESEFDTPSRILVSRHDNSVYVSDRHRIRRVRDGAVTTIAGSGEAGMKDNKIGSEVRFSEPNAMVESTNGQYLIIVDHNNMILRRMDVASGATYQIDNLKRDRIELIQQWSIFMAPTLEEPETRSGTVTDSGERLFVCGWGQIRVYHESTELASTLRLSLASLQPSSVVPVTRSILAFTCTHSHSVYLTHIFSGETVLHAGSGSDPNQRSGGWSDAELLQSRFQMPNGIDISTRTAGFEREIDNNYLYVADGNAIRRIPVSDELITSP